MSKKMLLIILVLFAAILMLAAVTETEAAGQTIVRPVIGTVSQEFGVYNPTYGWHWATDIAAPKGTSVLAVSNGVVQDIRTGSYHGDSRKYGAGNFVVIKHVPGDLNRVCGYYPAETWTVYCHLDTVKVSKCEQVIRGEKIATVGNTGFADGYHIHFEIRENSRYGTKIDSRNYVKYCDGKDKNFVAAPSKRTKAKKLASTWARIKSKQ